MLGSFGVWAVGDSVMMILAWSPNGSGNSSTGVLILIQFAERRSSEVQTKNAGSLGMKMPDADFGRGYTYVR